jgi:D-glucuronyl C5-epimerase C-terminus
MREYYIDLGFKDVRTGLYNNFDFDEDGIPRYRFPIGLLYTICRFPSGRFYNISWICHFALYHHSLYLKFKRSDDIDLFMHVSKWIIEHGEETDEPFVFPNAYRWERLSPPWISALGQGRVLSVLTRAYELSGDERYIAAARKAMKPFEIPVSQGGVQAHFPDGGVGFEEYPWPKPNIVLNGFITSLVGLHDLGEVEGEAHATELFMQGVRSLESNLHRYDLGYWSAYDLTGHVASEDYHLYHIMQLWALYEMTDCDIFKKYSSKWQGYRKGIRLHVFRGFSLGRRLLSRYMHRYPSSFKPGRSFENPA